MGLRPLGDAWKRRISAITGMDVIHASGSGGSEFLFTTADHKHGRFSRHHWYWANHGQPELADDIWAIYIDSTGIDGDNCTAGLYSCKILFPKEVITDDAEDRGSDHP